MRKKAITAINSRGCLLVYPLANRAEPRSVWSELFPRSKMRWDWDNDGDNRVAELWYLKEELSRSREVIYSKWFQNRATLFSFEVFVNLMAFLRAPELADGMSGESRNALDYLLSDSPLSTKQLKAALELEGRLLEPSYNRALKPLWQQGMIVAFGEFEDSSFPSLGIGATATLFEELWNEASRIDSEAAEKFLLKKLGGGNPFYKFALKIKKLQPSQTVNI
ncbi:MAG: AlkZ-related protein [Bdellovibrionales bacterium]